MNHLSRFCSITGVLLSFLFYSKQASAQNFNYVAAANRVVSAQTFNMQMMTNMQMMNMARWSYKDNMFTNNKLTFELELNNAEQKKVKSKIYIDTLLRKTYLVVVNDSFPKGDPKREQRIYPADVKNINIKHGMYEGTFMPKLTTDSCWMFKVIEGDINVYSNALAIVALQKKDGPVVAFSVKNLEPMVSDDQKAKKFFDKKDYLKAVNKYNSDHEPKSEDNYDYH